MEEDTACLSFSWSEGSWIIIFTEYLELFEFQSYLAYMHRLLSWLVLVSLLCIRQTCSNSVLSHSREPTVISTQHPRWTHLPHTHTLATVCLPACQILYSVRFFFTALHTRRVMMRRWVTHAEKVCVYVCRESTRERASAFIFTTSLTPLFIFLTMCIALFEVG